MPQRVNQISIIFPSGSKQTMHVLFDHISQNIKQQMSSNEMVHKCISNYYSGTQVKA